MYIQLINYDIHDKEGGDDEYGPKRRERRVVWALGEFSNFFSCFLYIFN